MENSGASFHQDDRIGGAETVVGNIRVIFPHRLVLPQDQIGRIAGCPLSGEFVAVFLDLYIDHAAIFENHGDIEHHQRSIIHHKRRLIFDRFYRYYLSAEK